jgi:hypothetical protein
VNDEVKEYCMGRACNTHGEEEENIQQFRHEARWKRTTGKIVDIGGRIM